MRICKNSQWLHPGAGTPGGGAWDAPTAGTDPTLHSQDEPGAHGDGGQMQQPVTVTLTQAELDALLNRVFAKGARAERKRLEKAGQGAPKDEGEAQRLMAQAERRMAHANHKLLEAEVKLQAGIAGLSARGAAAAMHLADFSNCLFLDGAPDEAAVRQALCEFVCAWPEFAADAACTQGPSTAAKACGQEGTQHTREAAMTDLEKVRNWLQTFPDLPEDTRVGLADALPVEYKIDYRGTTPGGASLFPQGLVELERRQDLLGHTIVTNEYNFVLYRVYEKNNGDDAAATHNAEWALALQRWVQQQSAQGKAPVFGNVHTGKEIFRAEEGMYIEEPEETMAFYAVLLRAQFQTQY